MTSTVPMLEAARLVGREAQLAELSAVLSAAEQGRGGLVLLVGEAGIGKSALAQEFARLADERGATITWGRAWEAGGAPPFWPWIEVLRGLPIEPDDKDLDAVRSSLAVVAELVPELGAQVSGLKAPTPLEAAQARFRLFDAVTTLLRWSSRNQPVVVILDDLHDADPATLSLLHFVAHRVRRARVLLLGTFRDADARLDPLVAEELARVAREGRYLPLDRLNRDAVVRWLEKTAVAASPHLLDELYRRSEGNPLFLVEMIRLLRTTPGLELSAPASLPQGIWEVIGARLYSLPPGSLPVLELGAVVGRTFEVQLVAAGCDIPAAEVRGRIAAALRVEVVAPAGVDRYMFTHILIREALHESLPTMRRAELHETVARTLMNGVKSVPLEEIVHHLYEAAPKIGITEAIAWARRAAQASLDLLAFAEAMSFLERALDALPANGDRRERCDVLLELARARIGAGQGERGREAALAAAALARQLGDAERLARAALRYGEVFNYATVNPTLVPLLEEALNALADDDDELRARLLGRLASAKQPASDPSEPMAIARKAIAMARRLANPDARMAVLQSATSALLYFADPDERIALNHELLELASRNGDRLRALRGHLRLVFDYLECGDVVRADACIEAYETLAKEIDHPTYLWYAPLLRSSRAAMRGSFAEAEALVERARALAERSEEPNRALTFALHRIGLLTTWAHVEALSEEGPALLQVVAERTDPWLSGPLRALFAARLGQPASARAALNAYDAELSEARGRMAVAWIAQAAVALADRPLAARAYEHLLPLAARNHCLGVAGCFCLGPMSHPLGTTAALLERWDDAWAHFEDASRRAEMLQSPPQRAQIELDYALALLRCGNPSDHTRACRLLDSAQTLAERFGLSAIADACAEQLDELGSERRGSQPRNLGSKPMGVPEATDFELRHDGQRWAVRWGPDHFELDDSRGLQILAQLVSHPDQEVHVTDLLAPPGEPGRVQDAGEMLDSAAVTSYRRRARELTVELEEAERWNDPGRAERLRRELEFLRAELSRAVGLGGRRRRAASSTERARINVRRRIVHALEKIEERCPGLAQHLRWAVKTGHYCAYHPSGRPR